MSRRFQVIRGLKAKLPVLAQGELGMTTDEQGLYLGNGAENIRLVALGGDGKIPPTCLPPMDYIPMSEKGQPNGVAVLGADGKLPKDALQATDDALTYGKTDGLAGKWDKLNTVPTGTQPIRYNGFLRATRVYGMYYSDAADYAEAYAVNGQPAPGDLIAITETGLSVNEIAENPAVLGFVSDTFATLIGVDDDHRTPIGLAGRLRVKAVGAIHAGDFLTGTSTPGAVSAVRGQVPRGAIVGQALETNLTPGLRRIWACAVRM